jgi:hypothetical protein
MSFVAWRRSFAASLYLTVKLFKQRPTMSFYWPWTGSEKLYDVVFKTFQAPGCEGLPPAGANGQTWRMLFNSASFLFAFLPVSFLVFFLLGSRAEGALVMAGTYAKRPGTRC